MATKKYQAKSTYIQADLYQSFLDIHCAKGGNIREFLENLCCKQEKIATARVNITSKEYKYTILYGITSDLVIFISQIMSLATLVHHATFIDVNALINLICEEVEQLKVSALGDSQAKEERKRPLIRPQQPPVLMAKKNAVKASAIIVARPDCHEECHNIM